MRFLKQALAPLALGTTCLVGNIPGGLSFLENHCLDCHDAEMAKGALVLESLTDDLMNLDHREEWIRIYDIVMAGKMPPPKKSKLSEEQRQKFTQNLKTAILKAEQEEEQKLGLANVRRLNRVEYENTLRDLLHLPLLRQLVAGSTIVRYIKSSMVPSLGFKV